MAFCLTSGFRPKPIWGESSCYANLVPEYKCIIKFSINTNLITTTQSPPRSNAQVRRQSHRLGIHQRPHLTWKESQLQPKPTLTWGERDISNNASTGGRGITMPRGMGTGSNGSWHIYCIWYILVHMNISTKMLTHLCLYIQCALVWASAYTGMQCSGADRSVWSGMKLRLLLRSVKIRNFANMLPQRVSTRRRSIARFYEIPLFLFGNHVIA
jgi:hypothetical protein